MMTQAATKDDASAANEIIQKDIPRDRSAAFEDVLRHFAGVSGRSPDEVRQEVIGISGNIVITDKEAKAIFAHLEAQYHRDDLFSASDLCTPTEISGSSESGKRSQGHGGCLDPAEDTTMCDLVDIVALKLGI